LRGLRNWLFEQRIEVGPATGLRRLPLAQQFAAEGPVVAVMLVDEHLGRAALQFEDFRDGIGDGNRQSTALFEGTAPGDMDGDKWHVALLYPAPL